MLNNPKNDLDVVMNCLAIAISERDQFLPVVYSASKLPCVRLGFEPSDCLAMQPDQSFWCVPCKARDAYQCADEMSFHEAQTLIDNYYK